MLNLFERAICSTFAPCRCTRRGQGEQGTEGERRTRAVAVQVRRAVEVQFRRAPRGAGGGPAEERGGSAGGRIQLRAHPATMAAPW